MGFLLNWIFGDILRTDYVLFSSCPMPVKWRWSRLQNVFSLEVQPRTHVRNKTTNDFINPHLRGMKSNEKFCAYINEIWLISNDTITSQRLRLLRYLDYLITSNSSFKKALLIDFSRQAHYIKLMN